MVNSCRENLWRREQLSRESGVGVNSQLMSVRAPSCPQVFPGEASAPSIPSSCVCAQNAFRGSRPSPPRTHPSCHPGQGGHLRSARGREEAPRTAAEGWRHQPLWPSGPPAASTCCSPHQEEVSGPACTVCFSRAHSAGNGSAVKVRTSCLFVPFPKCV